MKCWFNTLESLMEIDLFTICVNVRNNLFDVRTTIAWSASLRLYQLNGIFPRAIDSLFIFKWLVHWRQESVVSAEQLNSNLKSIANSKQ